MFRQSSGLSDLPGRIASQHQRTHGNGCQKATLNDCDPGYIIICSVRSVQGRHRVLEWQRSPQICAYMTADPTRRGPTSAPAPSVPAALLGRSYQSSLESTLTASRLSRPSSASRYDPQCTRLSKCLQRPSDGQNSTRQNFQPKIQEWAVHTDSLLQHLGWPHMIVF